MARLKETRSKLLYRALGCFLTFAAGVALLLIPHLGLEKLSYELPFFFRSDLKTTNAIIVSLNASALEAALQPGGPLSGKSFNPPLRTNYPPDRRIYAELLRQMKADGARFVFFDFNFNKKREGEDEVFAEAIKMNGSVILGGIYDGPPTQQTGDEAELATQGVLPPNETLLAEVSGWGLLAVGTGEQSSQIFMGDSLTNAAILIPARTNGFRDSRHVRRWLNFYGEPGAIPLVDLSRALDSKESGLFRNRTVFVGGGDSLNLDLHATLYSDWGRRQTLGVEILATSYLNLTQGVWLERISKPGQVMIMLIWACVVMMFLFSFRPGYALLAGLAIMFVPIAAGFYSSWEYHRWWSWTIAAFVQTPLAAVWAMGVNRWKPWPPIAFISYRRHGGSPDAQAIASALEQCGYGSIRDVSMERKSENYRARVKQYIERVENFILIVTPNLLRAEVKKQDGEAEMRTEELAEQAKLLQEEVDEIVIEVWHAVEEKKHIVIVIIDGCEIPPASAWPKDLREVPRIDAINWQHNDPEGAVRHITTNLKRRPLFSWQWLKWCIWER